MPVAGSITINPTGQIVVLDVLAQGVANTATAYRPSAFSDEALATALPLPTTITVPTTVYLKAPTPGLYSVSAKIGGQESATAQGVAASVSFVNGNGFHIAPVVPASGSATLREASSSRSSPGTLWGGLGDSITDGTGASNFLYAFFPQAVSMVGGLLARSDSIEAGVGGERADQVLARMQSTIDLGVRGVVLLVGTNEASNSLSAASFVSTVTAMIRTCKNQGIPVVVCTVPPRGSGAAAAIHASITAYNIALRALAPAFACELADTYTALVDTTTGNLAAAYDSGDGTHPNTLGHQKLAIEVAKAMRRTARLDVSNLPQGFVRTVSPSILNTDPLNVRATPTTAPWSEWSGGTGTAPTYSMVNDPVTPASGATPAVVLPAGRWAQMDFDATAGGTRRLAGPGWSTGYSAGDTLLYCGHVQLEDVSGTWPADVIANTCDFIIQPVNQSGAAIALSRATYRVCGVPNSGNATCYDLGPFAFPFVVPSGTTMINVWHSLTLATGKRIKLRLGCTGVFNLTTLGLTSQFGLNVMVNT